MKLSKSNADVAYGIVILGFAAVMLVHTFSSVYDAGLLFGDVSTVFVPRILLISICLLAAGLVLKGVIDRDKELLETMNWRRIALTFTACCVTTAGVWYLGYLIAMPIGIFLTGLAIGYPNKPILAIASLAATGVVWFALGYIARVSLPEGILF